MLLAEVDLIRGAHTPASPLPIAEKALTTTIHCRMMGLFWAGVSILSLYLLSQPDLEAKETPGWVYLGNAIPDWWTAEPYRYWQSAGAILFVLAASRCCLWQRFFNSFFVQYFGKISYAIYLMHGPAMHVAGYHFEKWAWSITGTEGKWYEVGFFLGAIFCVPTVVWWADVFWRAVDVPTVKLAKWLESKCIVKR